MTPARGAGSTRRAFVANVGAAALGGVLGACRRERGGAPVVAGGGAGGAVAPAPLTVSELRFDEGPGGPQRVVVVAPAAAPPGSRFPLLVALHGRGEAGRGLAAGAWGWVRDYWLDRAMARLGRPPLTAADLRDVATPDYLGRLNAAAAARPYGGLVVACPFTPDILGTPDLDAAAPFGAFLTGTLIPRLRRDFAVLPQRAATGLDGVSLGGRVALLVGMAHPEAFGAVGTLQAAFRPGEIPEVAARAHAMLGRAPAPPRLRLLTSTGDFFRPTLAQLAEALERAGWRPELTVVPGPHDYDFNRGPGAYEMLLWHDRVLRGG